MAKAAIAKSLQNSPFILRTMAMAMTMEPFLSGVPSPCSVPSSSPSPSSRRRNLRFSYLRKSPLLDSRWRALPVTLALSITFSLACWSLLSLINFSSKLSKVVHIQVYPALLAGRDDELEEHPVKKTKQDISQMKHSKLEARCDTGHSPHRQASRTPYDLWNSQPDHNLERWYEGCSHPEEKPPELPANPTGYLIVQPDGGLNQQRIGIVTSVAIASFLQATLVVPRLLFSPVWKDDSQFEDLFDLNHFNESLKNIVRIVNEVPREVQGTLKTANVTLVVPKHCSLEWYSAHVLPVLKKYGVVVLTAYMHPLGFGMPFHVEQIRCRANYYALRYNRELEGIAKQAVQQIRKDGEKFVAVHIRFQKDMLADSCCDFGGGPAEWEFFKKYRDVNLAIGQYHVNKYKSKPPPEILRARGLCPLTPEELGLLLAGMGFSKDTRLYLAGGEVYGGESRLAPLRHLFPKMVRMEDVVPRNLLWKLRSHASRLAVIDTYICTYSNVFLSGFSGSNLPGIALGLRMMYRLGPSILPSKQIAPLLMAAKAGQIRWKEFAAQVKSIQTPKRISNSWNVSTFREPAPACVCYRPGLTHTSS